MKILQLSVLLFLINAAAAAAFSCSCMLGGAPCQSYGSTPVVFSGKVTAVETFETTREGVPFKIQQRRVRLAVLESFKGIDSQAVDVVTGQGGGDCGYDFKVNESYLIYAWEEKGKLSTGICSRTRPMADALEDLEYIRGLSKAAPEGRIFGTIFLSKPRRSDEAWQPNPKLAGLGVTAAGPKGTVTMQTDADGQFSFENSPPGDYLISVLAPKGLHPERLEQKVKLSPKGCAAASMAFAPETAVKGRLSNERGEPGGDIGVNLVPIEYIAEAYQKDAYYSQTDAEGKFVFRSIPPGRYYLGVRLKRTTEQTFKYPRTFYPGTQRLDAATVLIIGEGQVLNGYNFELPAPLTERTIEGVVTFPDGKPAAGASIATEEIEYAPGSMGFSDATADAKGRFSMKRLEGLKYLVRIHINMPDGQQRHAEPQEVPATGDRKTLKFVISEAGGSCSKCRR